MNSINVKDRNSSPKRSKEITAGRVAQVIEHLSINSRLFSHLATPTFFRVWGILMGLDVSWLSRSSE
jgi:hypothetical protein